MRRSATPALSPRRADAKASTRRRILEAARDVFAREGYHAATMDTIAGTAGVSKGALYFHFPGKLDLFSVLVDEFACELGAGVAQAIGTHRGGVAKVEAALGAAIDTFSRQRSLARIVLVEAASLGPAYAAKRQEVLGRFAMLIRHELDGAVSEGVVPALDTAVVAYAWLGAVNELVTQWLAGEVADLSAAAPALSALLLRSIAAHPPASAQSDSALPA